MTMRSTRRPSSRAAIAWPASCGMVMNPQHHGEEPEVQRDPPGVVPAAAERRNGSAHDDCEPEHDQRAHAASPRFLGDARRDRESCACRRRRTG